MSINSIKKRRDFLLASKYGKKRISSNIIVLVNEHVSQIPDYTNRVGFTITKKIGNAVKRNKVKRRLRAIWQNINNNNNLTNADYVLIARYQAASASYNTLYNDLNHCLKYCYN